jgi:hypothetical protein
VEVGVVVVVGVGLRVGVGVAVRVEVSSGGALCAGNSTWGVLAGGVTAGRGPVGMRVGRTGVWTLTATGKPERLK